MSLPEVNFVETDTNTIKSEIIAGYERAAGRSLAHGDPVRLFLESMASVIAHQHVLINDTGKMNLLAYARGDYLDHIGLLVGTYRMPAVAATAQSRVTRPCARMQSRSQKGRASVPQRIYSFHWIRMLL